MIPNHSPFSTKSKLVCVALEDVEGLTVYKIEYGLDPFGEALKEIKRRIELADMVVGHSAKFDYHWIRRYVPDIKFPRVFDTQLCEFLLLDQQDRMPSLDACLAARGMELKRDVVKLEYWSLGIDTPDIPWETLAEYAGWDCHQTLELARRQFKELTPEKSRLLKLQLDDLKFLAEAEANGLRYDFDEAAKRSAGLQQELSKIDAELHKLAGVDFPINFGSSDQLSALLYGGTIEEKYREQYQRVLKDGTIRNKERWSVRSHLFDGLVSPIDGTESDVTSGRSDEELRQENDERASNGKRPVRRIYSTAEPVLRRLRPRGVGKSIVGHLLRRSELEKLDSTYYGGLIEKREAAGWRGDELHGQFNQSVTATGRLSSSEPNLQNLAGDMKELFYSRYQ